MPVDLGKAILLYQRQEAERSTWTAEQWETHLFREKLSARLKGLELAKRCMDARDDYWRERLRQHKEQQVAPPDLSTVLFVSVEEAAAIIGLKRTKMYQLLKRGAILSVKEGRRRMVSVHALERYRESMEASACHDAGTEMARLPGAKMGAGKPA